MRNAENSVDGSRSTGIAGLLHTGRISPPAGTAYTTGVTAGILGGTANNKYIADNSGSGLASGVGVEKAVHVDKKEVQVQDKVQVQVKDEVQVQAQVQDEVQVQVQVQAQQDTSAGFFSMRKLTDDNANDDGSINNKEDDDGAGLDKDKDKEEEEEAIKTETEAIIDQQESQPRPTNSDSKASTLLHVAEAAKAVNVNRPLNLTRDPSALAHLLKTKRSQRGRKSDPRMEVAVVAKLSNPALTLRQALVQGGFVFRPKHNPAGPLGLGVGGFDERRGRKGRAPKGTANDLVDQDGEYWLVHVALVCLCIYIYIILYIYIYGFRLAVAFAS